MHEHTYAYALACKYTHKRTHFSSFIYTNDCSFACFLFFKCDRFYCKRVVPLYLFYDVQLVYAVFFYTCILFICLTFVFVDYLYMLCTIAFQLHMYFLFLFFLFMSSRTFWQHLFIYEGQSISNDNAFVTNNL